MNNTDLEHFKTLIAEASFHIENVEGWLSVEKTDAALIKARYLIDAVDKLKKLLKKYEQHT